MRRARFEPTPESWWWANSARVPLPRVDLDAFDDVDLVVVGLGTTGLVACAVAAAAGARVVGVDAGTIGRGAAGANGGFLLCGASRFPHDAATAFGQNRARWLFERTAAEIDREVADLASHPVRWVRDGSLRVAGHPYTGTEPEEGEVVDLALHAATLRDFGVVVDERTVGGVPGLWIAPDGWVNPVERLVAYADLARSNGATLVEHAPVRALHTNEVHFDHTTVRCASVLVCVDGFLEDLVPGLDLQTYRLEMLATATPSNRHLSLPTYMRFGFDYGYDLDPSDPRAGFVLGGYRDRHRIHAAASGFDGPPRPTGPVQRDLDQLAAAIAGVPVEVTARWSAAVSYTTDGWPMVAETQPGVFVTGGYSGQGNLVGPFAARTIATALYAGTAEAAAARSDLDLLAR